MSTQTVESYDAILDRAVVLWASTRRGYRDGMIEVGRALHEYVVRRLGAGVGLAENARRAIRATREHAIKDAASRLCISMTRVNELIRVAAVVDLFGGDGIGSLSYSSLRLFRTLIHRPAKGRQISRTASGADGASPTEAEVWAVRPNLANSAPKLFRLAVSEGYSEKQIRDHLTGEESPVVVARAAARVESQGTYTAGDVARICSVSPGTAAKWVDSGLLPGRRVPMSKHRRVDASDLAAFLEKHDIAAPPELQVAGAAVSCGFYGVTQPGTATLLDPIEFGAFVATNPVRLVAIGDEYGLAQSLRMAEFAFSRRTCSVVVVVSDEQSLPTLTAPEQCSFTATKRPVDWFALGVS